MAILNVSALIFDQSAITGEMRPIGSFAMHQQVNVTQIFVNSMSVNQIIFGKQIPIQAIARENKTLREKDSNEVKYSINVMEFKVEQISESILEGDILVCAAVPYSKFWVESATFKKGCKQKPSHEKFKTAEQFENEVEKAKHNWWDTANKYFTATLLPKQLNKPIIEQRKSTNNSSKWVIGVLQNNSNHTRIDFDDITTIIYKSRQFQSLLDLTNTGKLRVGPKMRKIKGATIEAANLCANIAIKQALAGPHKEEDITRFEGKPVVDLACRLFKDLVDTIDKRKESQLAEMINKGIEYDSWEEKTHNNLQIDYLSIDENYDNLESLQNYSTTNWEGSDELDANDNEYDEY